MSKRRGRRASVALCGLLAWEALGCRAQPVAILTEAQGSYRVELDGRTVPGAPMTAVERGSALVLAPDARVVLAYTEGGWVFELRGEGRFLAQPRGVESRDGRGLVRRRNLAAALHALKIRTDGVTLQGSVSMRGTASTALRANGPVGTHLAQNALSVCWQALGPRWRYHLRLIDQDGEVVFERETGLSLLQLPALQDLRPGSAYIWQLIALGPGGRTAEAAGQFERVDAPTERALLEAQAVATRGDKTDRALYSIARSQRGLAAGVEAHCTAAADK